MEQEFIFLKSIEYFADYHSRNFFHGDIKPDNLLKKKKGFGFDITSDAGTLLDLGVE
jgi:serine/threonine protein kinase